MRTAMGIAITGLLLTVIPATAQPPPSLEWLRGPPPPPPPEGETDRIIIQRLEAVGERHRGMPPYYNGGIYGDIIGTFFGLLATGAYDQARGLRDGVCAAWRVMPPSGPFTGRASIGGVDVILDTMCGVNK